MKAPSNLTLLKHTFSRKNFIAVFFISLGPIILGTIEYILGFQHAGYEVSSPLHLLYNWIYSLLVTSSLFFGSACIIAFLNRDMPWKSHFARRILMEIGLIFTYTTFTQYLILIVLKDTPIMIGLVTPELIFRNIIFSNTITLIVVTIIEGIYFFRNWRESLVAAERMEKEHLQSNLSNLRAQLDPHFMFNSLNVLSSLIRTDPAKAEKFVDDFAKVYRYLLDVKNEVAVPLKKELAFVERYLNLQKIRFDKGLLFEMHINPDHLNHYLPPLSLQEMVGNAIKHNIISSEHPLRIEITSHDMKLSVENNVQMRGNGVESTGVGLQNLRERYRYLSAVAPSFELANGKFRADLPLIKLEE